jgi:membrane dipeptidase
MLIVDAHLDLAYNALRGREVLRPAIDQTADEEGIPSVGLPDLRAGGVHLICATIFCAPDSPKERGYRTADEAHAMATDQLNWYRRQADAGEITIARRGNDLAHATGVSPVLSTSPGPDARTTGKLFAIILLEGADPIREPADVAEFFKSGVRIVGLAWKRTRYAGGTGAPGPLTPEGVALVRELDRAGIIHDASHLAEESFWQLLDLAGGPVMASHSNCRSIVPTDRQLSDPMIRAIARREGVIGINFYDRFLVPPDQHAKRRAKLDDVAAHLRHMCDVIGSADHVGIGTDMDGGLGREQIPQEIQTSADLPRVADALSSAGFADEDVLKIMGGNWIRFFAKALPQS